MKSAVAREGFKFADRFQSPRAPPVDVRFRIILSQGIMQMRKMKLDIDRLAVESFAMVDGGTDVRGTIRGKEATTFCTRFYSCEGYTCELSCGGSCYTAPNCQQVC